MRIMVNSLNVRSFRCSNCGDTVNFDRADKMMRERQLCDKCLNKKIAEEDKECNE